VISPNDGSFKGLEVSGLVNVSGSDVPDENNRPARHAMKPT
jgi:hypothetical protein